SGVIDPEYDAAGNMTAMPNPTSWTNRLDCTWDAWNRLTEIKQGSVAIAKYSYDARTRRIRSGTGYQASNDTDFYYNMEWRALESRGEVHADYVYSPYDRWNLIRRRRSVSSTFDETRYVLRDYLDPVAIIQTDGTVDERYGYDAFGPVRI